jgi:hypothetical protein
LPPTDKRRPRRSASSIRAAAESAAGSTSRGAPKRDRGGAAAPQPKRAAKPKAQRSSVPKTTGEEAVVFPDYETRTDAWDPWDEGAEPPGRIDPDFDAQRTLGEWLEGVIPPDAQVHFINAGREFAAGVQVTVDHHTGKRAIRPGEDRPGGATRIEIE